MRKHFHKLLAAAITFMTVVGFYMPAQAALMGDAKVTLSNTTAGTASNYAFSMKTGSNHAPQGIKITWLTAATGGAAPTGLAGAPTLHSTSANMATGGVLTDGSDWTTDVTKLPKAAGGYITMTNAGVNAINKAVFTFQFNGITNPTITQRNDGAPGCTSTNNAGTGNGNLTTGTCFIKIETYDTDNTANFTAQHLQDNVTIAYAVTSDVQMTAKVDPALTFVVAGIPQNASTYATGVGGATIINIPTANGVGGTNTGGTGGTTNGTDSNPLLIDFQTLTPNVIRLLSEALTVRTNANSGYYVYGRMTKELTGTSVNTNLIDEFTGGGATATAPAVWTSPTSTTKNSYSGFLGYNTTQHANLTNIANFADTTWAPLSDGDPTKDVAPTQPHTMMEKSVQDDGLTATVVSFALEVNVYQPSDSYAGTLQYNVVPKY